MTQRQMFMQQHRDERGRIYPARDEYLVDVEGLDLVTRDATEAFRAAWPYRNTNLGAYITVLANVRTLRDVARLSS